MATGAKRQTYGASRPPDTIGFVRATCAFMHECMTTQTAHTYMNHQPPQLPKAMHGCILSARTRMGVSGDGYETANLRTGRAQSSPPESEGLSAAEELLSLLSAAVVPSCICKVHLVQPNPVLSSADRMAPLWRDHIQPQSAFSGAAGSR